MKKRILASLLAALLTLTAAMLAPSIAETGDEAAEHVPGDVFVDGKLNARDVTALMKKLVGLNPENFDESRADFNGDGRINARDVVAMIKTIIAGDVVLERTAQDIIEELVVDHASYGGVADAKVDALLAELGTKDADTAARWRKIIGVWKDCEAGVELNYDLLPDGLSDTDELCIVVLGYQLSPDGTMKNELIERLTVAKNSAEKYPNAIVVCTGGGTARDNKDATEAGEMAKWLIENGIAEERVVVENKSLTTAQNAIKTFDILAKDHPQVKKIAIISSDYHIATGVLLFSAEAILRAENADAPICEIVSNAAWKAPSGTLSSMFQAGALIELSGDVKTAFEIYYDTYDIHELPPIG